MRDLRTTHPLWTSHRFPVIGMVHLQPLPGSPRFGGSLAEVIEAAVADAEALVAGGVDGMMIENFGDAPFYPQRIPAETVAGISVVGREVRRQVDLPLGINVLRNDGLAALAIAVALDALFVRVNVLCGARLTDQGLISGEAHHVLRRRSELGAEHIAIFADVDVKHSAPLVERSLASEVSETLSRGGADAVIVSGSATGQVTSDDHLHAAIAAAAGAPVLIGSGLTAAQLPLVRNAADGAIVGSAFKPNQDVHARVQAELVKSFMSARAS